MKPLHLALLTALALAASALGSAQVAGHPQGTGASPGAKDLERVETASDGDLAVSMLWKSERAADRYVEEALAIARAVDEANRARGAGRAPRGPRELLLVESPAALARALRARSVTGEEKGMERFLSTGDLRDGLPAVAFAPRILDRPLFVVGIPPASGRAFSQAAAFESLRASGRVGAWGDVSLLQLGEIYALADDALQSAEHGRPAAREPYASSGLVDLRDALAEVPAGERAAALLALAEAHAAAVREQRGVVRWEPLERFAADAGAAAATLLASTGLGDDAPLTARAERALAQLDDCDPRWIVESGAVASHPFGWAAAAPAKSDALVLSAEPRPNEPFTLRVDFIALANDQKSSAQADFVLGDVDGSRLHIAVTSAFGFYLYSREGPGAPYEAISQRTNRRIFKGIRTTLTVEYDGEALVVKVGEETAAAVRLAGRSLAGRWGFGAHAGSTVLFSEPVFE